MGHVGHVVTYCSSHVGLHGYDKAVIIGLFGLPLGLFSAINIQKWLSGNGLLFAFNVAGVRNAFLIFLLLN